MIIYLAQNHTSITHVKSSLHFFVTSQTRHILSSGSSLRRAVLCMMAVSSDCGLKKPASHTTEGNYIYLEKFTDYECPPFISTTPPLTTKSVDHVSNSLNRIVRSKNHDVKPCSDGYARAVQIGGT